MQKHSAGAHYTHLHTSGTSGDAARPVAGSSWKRCLVKKVPHLSVECQQLINRDSRLSESCDACSSATFHFPMQPTALEHV
ncbi:hypothetical protein VTG60DRAFT_1659 [Thermothelomyces hinnuleus]